MSQAHTPSRPILTSVAAHLYVRDLEASTGFFTKKLGFAIDFVYGDPPFYGQASRDNARLALCHMDEPFFAEDIRQREGLLSASITLASADKIAQLFLAYQEAEVPLAQSLRNEPWQAGTFIVKTPTATSFSLPALQTRIWRGESVETISDTRPLAPYRYARKNPSRTVLPTTRQTRASPPSAAGNH